MTKIFSSIPIKILKLCFDLISIADCVMKTPRWMTWVRYVRKGTCQQKVGTGLNFLGGVTNFWALLKNCEKRPLASSCLSVYPNGTTRLPRKEFSRNLILENFSKMCRENSGSLKSDKNNGYSTLRPIEIYDNISLNFS